MRFLIIILLAALAAAACSSPTAPASPLDGHSYALVFHPVSDADEPVYIAQRMNGMELYISFKDGKYVLSGEDVQESGSYEFSGDSLIWTQRSAVKTMNGGYFLSYDSLTVVQLIQVE